MTFHPIPEAIMALHKLKSQNMHHDCARCSHSHSKLWSLS